MTSYLHSDSLFVWLGYTLIAVGSMLLAITLPLHVYWVVRSGHQDEYGDEADAAPIYSSR